MDPYRYVTTESRIRIRGSVPLMDADSNLSFSGFQDAQKYVLLSLLTDVSL
jgi:hypothetical protein